MIGVFNRQSGRFPRLVATDEIRDTREPEQHEVHRRQRRAVPPVAYHHQRLIRRRHRGMAIPTRRIEMPLQDGSWHVYRATDDTEAFAIGVGPRIDDGWRMITAQSLEQIARFDTADLRARLMDQVVHREPVSSPTKHGDTIID